jgi:putative hydrolase of the HAD superfamily
MNIRALLFDVNGTLIDIETDEHMEQAYRAIGHFLRYQGIGLRRWEVHDLYFQVMKEQFAATKEPFPEFDAVAVWREILNRKATAYTRALPADKLRQMPLFLAEMQRGISRKRIGLYPQGLEVLGGLKQRYPMAIVSDAQSAYGVPELKSVGIYEYFNPIVISGDFGYRKPDARLFQTALDRLGVHASEAVFIGNDRYRDVFGAQQVGMKTVLFASGPCPERPQNAEPDYIIYQFAELPQAIDFLSKQASGSRPVEGIVR